MKIESNGPVTVYGDGEPVVLQPGESATFALTPICWCGEEQILQTDGEKHCPHRHWWNFWQHDRTYNGWTRLSGHSAQIPVALRGKLSDKSKPSR